MSQDRTYHKPPRSQKSITAAHSRPQDLTQQIKTLDDKLRHLSDNILPKHPYLLSIPSDVPYRHSSRFVNTWHLGTPFAREEEQLQYMSFLPHQEEESSLIKAEGGWSDDSGNIVREEPSPQETYRSGANTPLTGAQRKKISLHDYKNKGKGGMEGTEQPLPLEIVDTREARDLQKQATKVNGGTSQISKEELPTQRSDILKPGNSKKRTHEETGGPPHQSPEPVRLEKKLRASTPEQEDTRKPATEPAMSSEQLPQRLPKVLSPTLPRRSTSPEIPLLLSSNQPPALEDFLTTEISKPQVDGVYDHHRTDSVRSILATAGLDPSLTPNMKKNPAIKAQLEVQRKRSDSQHSARSAVSDTSPAGVAANGRPISPAMRSAAGIESRSSTPRPNGARSSPGPRQRHTIILKYGKKNRKRVEALLKFAPRGKKPTIKAAPQQVIRSEQPRKSTENRPDTSQPQKRALVETSPDPAPKRQKLPTGSSNSAEKAQTPIPSGLDSPSLQGNRQPKSAFSTPKKEFKSSAMRRVESSEGFEARTPTTNPTRHSTPLSVEKSATKASPPRSIPASRDEERRAWHSLHQRYFELGRTIKKEGTNIGPSPTSDPNDKDSAKSIVLLIEAYLCFLIDFTAISQSHHGQDPGWRTILPYHNFVFRASKKFPQLHGLVTQLGAVCRQLIHKLDMDRLARDPLPDEQGGSAPTPGSDGNTKTNEDNDKYKKKYLDFRNDLVSNAKDLQIAWLDGSRLLSLDTIRQDYPETWAKRSKDSTLRGLDRSTPAKLGGAFFLPLDVSTTALEATRFGMAFLEEWTSKEDVDWKPRVEL